MFRYGLISMLAALATLVAAPAEAQIGADLNISPKRVVLNTGDRTATVYIFNQGDEAATYIVDLTDRVMSTDGQIAPIEDGKPTPAWSATGMLQYTPRRVTLAPKSNQAIRIRLRGGPDGEERRSHLTITTLPPENTGLTAQAAAAQAPGQLALQVIGLFSVSIPVIVRTDASVPLTAIVDPALVSDGNGTRVTFTVTRAGDASVYGDIEVYAGEGRKARLVGRTRGVAVYPEIDHRTFGIALTEPVAHKERLRIVYLDDDRQPGAELAAVTFAAP